MSSLRPPLWTPVLSESRAHRLFAGDLRVLEAARVEARRNFDTKRNLSAGSAEADAGVKHAEEVAAILRQNIVQGVEGNEGKYRKWCQEGRTRILGPMLI